MLRVGLRLRSAASRLVIAQRKRRALAHKRYLAEHRSRYTAYTQVAFVFQTFNKGQHSGQLLAPFLERGCRNICVFADGCVDSSALTWHKRLKGQNHIVLACNDLHEIRNYRLSLDIASAWGCSHVVLLQDDDQYDNAIFEWLDAALRASHIYRAALVGGNSGADLDSSFSYREGDIGLLSAEFTSGKREDGTVFNSLGDYIRMAAPTEYYPCQGLMPHRFVASVNRAPQLVDIVAARELSFFPAAMEPYQYDDYFNCFQAWLHGYSVVLMPFPKAISTCGPGGMRLYNNVTRSSRPHHFIRNWDHIFREFSSRFPRIIELVDNENSRLHSRLKDASE